MDLQELEKTSPFAPGKENTGYAQYFDGKSYYENERIGC